MNWEFIVIFAVLILLFIPLKIEGRASFNLLQMKGALGVFLYKFQVEKQRFRLSKGKILALSDDEKEEGEIDSTKLIFTKMLLSEIKDKTRLQELFVIYHLGLSDAYLSAMVAGHINTILYGLFASIKNYKPTASLGVSDNIAFNKEVAQFALTIKISISLFDVVYSLIRSVILTKKETNKIEVQNKGEAK